jgi:serine/threonine protein phosphatase PrpC
MPVCLIRSPLSFYAVFDGHGGKKASKYAAEHLPKIIAQKFPKGNVIVTSSQLPVN